MLMNAYQENTIVPLRANVSILWVHISAHIVDLDILTMERPVKVRFAYNEEDNEDKKKSSRYMGIREVTEWHVQATDAHLSHGGGYAYSVGI